MRRLLWTVLLVAVTLGAASCGGGGLRYKVDDVVLSDVPVDQKQNMLAAKADMDHAKEELNHARASLDTDRQDLAIARAGVSQAQQEINKAQARLDLSRRRANVAEMQSAQERLSLARLGVSTAKSRLDWVSKRQQLHQTVVAAVEAQGRVTEARYELAKAQLAQQVGKRPRADFSVSQYENQVRAEERQAQQIEQRATAQSATVEQAANQYGRLAAQYDEGWNRAPEPKPVYAPPDVGVLRTEAPPPSRM